MLATLLTKFQQSRRIPDWQPKPADYAKISIDPINDELINRCLEFADLELQVADWVGKSTTLAEKETDSETKETVNNSILRNVADEAKHDTVLHYLREYYNWAGPTAAANQLLNKWKSLNSHPISCAYSLECGVFFTVLPLFITKGDVYAATVGQWINDDERVHVETNLALMKHYHLELDKDLLRLVYETNEYIFQPLGTEEAKKQATRALMRTVSGRDRQMLQESIPATIAFFEQHTKKSIVY